MYKNVKYKNSGVNGLKGEVIVLDLLPVGGGTGASAGFSLLRKKSLCWAFFTRCDVISQTLALLSAVRFYRVGETGLQRSSVQDG